MKYLAFISLLFVAIGLFLAITVSVKLGICVLVIGLCCAVATCATVVVTSLMIDDKKYS